MSIWVNSCGYLYIVILHSILLCGFLLLSLSWSREAGSRPEALQWGESQGPGHWVHHTYCELHPRQRSPQCQDHHCCLSSSQSESKGFVLPRPCSSWTLRCIILVSQGLQNYFLCVKFFSSLVNSVLHTFSFWMLRHLHGVIIFNFTWSLCCDCYYSFNSPHNTN